MGLIGVIFDSGLDQKSDIQSVPVTPISRCIDCFSSSTVCSEGKSIIIS
jgi:hypothetical protein